jgi:hypothetical protein
MRKLFLQRRLFQVGRVSLTGIGNKKDVYCTRKIKSDNVLHEVICTKVARAYGWPSCNRFDEVGPLLPDMEMYMGGKLFNIEIDTGEMKRDQVQRRWSNYAMANESLLVVTPYKTRLEDLLRWSGEVKDLAYFAVLQDVINDPHGDIWERVDDEYTYRIGV